jgi:hypothetical protein
MKNNFKKGFVVPLLLGIIALLVIGGGIYIYQNRKAEAPTVVDTGTQQTNAQTPPVNTQTDNSNWKTYTNTKYGFEIKYSERVSSNVVNSELINFYYDTSEMKKILGAGLIKDNRILTISVMNNNDNLDIETWTKQTDITGFPTKSIKQIKFNGVDAVEKVSGEYNDNWITVNIGKNLKVYSLLYYKYGVPEMDLILNQILSTFKFTK